jgi:hypothetical protein
MRITLLLAVMICSSSFAMAGERLKVYDAPLVEEPSPYAGLDLSPEQLAAAQELELVQYRFVAWANFEFPLRLRQIDADIVMAREELASLQRRQSEYRHFNVWSRGGNPMFLQAEDAHLAAVAIQQRLQLLLEQRGQLLKFQPIEYRERQMALERARLNLRLAK